MQAGQKAWDTFPAAEQETKLRAIGKLLKEYNLEKVQPKTLDQVIFICKQGAVKRQKALLIQGSASSDKAD